MNLVVATLVTDRKPFDIDKILNSRARIPQATSIYINHEGHQALRVPAGAGGKPVHYDIWHVQQSSWRTPITYDQDQKRLLGIVTARNMAIDYALSVDATHLLFLDSDVFPEVGGIQYLVNLNVPLCGGNVPGRGDHGHVYYVFGAKRGIMHKGHLIECDHGTCGYMLIQRSVFGRLRFRWGDDPEVENGFLSEDPAYCEDWYRISGQRFLIDKRAEAIHEGELSANEAAQDAWATMQGA